MDSHFKSLALRVSLISRVANPKRMSAFRVWWLQTRKINLLTGVTILWRRKKNEDMSQSNVRLCFRFSCSFIRCENVFERVQRTVHCFFTCPTYWMIIFHKRDSFHRLDEQTQYNEKMQNPNRGKKTEV